MRVPAFISCAVAVATIANVSWATVPGLTFRDVQAAATEIFEANCRETIEQSEMETVAHAQTMLVFRSTSICQTGSTGRFCATRFVTTDYPKACSPIHWTRGRGVMIDDTDPITDHFAIANQTLTGPPVLMSTIQGAVLAGPTTDGVSIHFLP